MKRLIIAALAVAAVLVVAGTALAASIVGPIGFDSYTDGNIHGQQGWSKTGAYDAEVVNTSRLGFGKALRISNAITSGAFGDQTFSPGVTAAKVQFDSSFTLGTTTDTLQDGLAMSVSPDNGQGGRMSYLRFVDTTAGIEVYFDDFKKEKADFVETKIATLSRTAPHTIRFLIQLKKGTDGAKIFIEGKQVWKGTTWEGYYPESVPTVSKMLFRAGGTAAPTTSGQGFLIDNVQLASN